MWAVMRETHSRMVKVFLMVTGRGWSEVTRSTMVRQTSSWQPSVVNTGSVDICGYQGDNRVVRIFCPLGTYCSTMTILLWEIKQSQVKLNLIYYET